MLNAFDAFFNFLWRIFSRIIRVNIFVHGFRKIIFVMQENLKSQLGMILSHFQY